MDWAVLFGAAQPIPVHATLAILAVLLGGVQFALPKGTILHRTVGYVWIAAMLVVALSSFFINEFRWVGPFGPIHLLSCLVLYSLWQGVSFARQNEIKQHNSTMLSLYVYSLLLAGGFTFVPGRIMHSVFFG